MPPGATPAPAARSAAAAAPSATAAPSAAISERLADFTAGLSLDAVPRAVAARAKHLILDAIGCALAARTEPFARQLADSVAKLAGPGPRAVIGMARRLPLRDAAVVNGALIHGLDYDDTHAAGIVHLTVSTFPAALATAAHLGATGAELLVAYVAGVETGARVAAIGCAPGTTCAIRSCGGRGSTARTTLRAPPRRASIRRRSRSGCAKR